MVIVSVAILAALLIIGAAIDIKSRRLPNWLTGGVAGLYVLYATTAPFPVDWTSALLVAGASFAVGFTLFAFNLMGGGDVKLISGLALWAGVDFIALFLLMTGLAGGVMSVCILLFRRLANHPLSLVFGPYISVVMANRLGFAFPASQSENGMRQTDDEPGAGSIPYGVAIAAGGFAVICALLKL